MKMRRCLIAMLLFVGSGSMAVRADDLFQLYWRCNYYATNSTGHIIAVRFTEQDFVNQVASDTGQDPNSLVLVYRPRKRDVAVVQGNGAFVASVVQMQSTYTDVDNARGTVTVRHAILTDQSHQSPPLGSFFGLELRTLDSNGGVVGTSLIGTVLYSKSDTGQVFGGQISTGGRIVDSTNAP